MLSSFNNNVHGKSMNRYLIIFNYKKKYTIQNSKKNAVLPKILINNLKNKTKKEMCWENYPKRERG